MTHRERHRVALAERNHFWPRLHTRPLLGEDKLTAREIPLRFRQQDCYLYRENVLPVKILVKAVEVTFAVLEEQWRRPPLPCVVASLQKLFVLVGPLSVCTACMREIRLSQRPREFDGRGRSLAAPSATRID